MREIINKRFDEVFDLQMGKTPDRNQHQYFEGDNVWVSIRDMVSKELCDSKEHLSDEAVSKSGIKKVKAGTVIMSFKLTVGKCAIATTDLFTNEAIMAFNVKDGFDVSPYFLYYYLQGYKWAGANKAVMGLTLNKATISQQRITVPPLPEQQRIVSELDLLSSIIDKQKAQLKELDTLCQSIFYDMFGDPVENEKGWPTSTMQGMASKNKNSIKRGPFGGALKKEMFVEEGYLVYEQYHALNDDYSFARYFISEEKYKEMEDFSVCPGDIIISCSGVNLGKLSIVPKNARPGIINQALLKISLDSRIYSNILFLYVFSAPSFKEKHFGYNRGCAIPNIPPMGELRKIPFPLPPLPLQHLFSQKIQAIESQKAAISSSLAETQKLFDYTMDKYFG